MGTRSIFEDENGNQMDCYINTKGLVFIQVRDSEQPEFVSSYITLDKEDTAVFIKLLQDLHSQME